MQHHLLQSAPVTPFASNICTLRCLFILCCKIVNHDYVLVQIEVDSGNEDTSIRKLGFGLVDQLRWLRNRRTTIRKCCGFYFMAGNRGPGHVRQVEVLWNEELFKFMLTARSLGKDTLLKSKQVFTHVYKKELSLIH